MAPVCLLLVPLLVPQPIGAEPEASRKQGSAIENVEGPGQQLKRYVEEGPRCRKDAKYCFGVALHVALDHGRVGHTLDWIRGQFSTMRSRFAAIDVDFELVSAVPHRSEDWHVATRSQRDGLGRSGLNAGLVDVFLVGRLDDVDKADTQIRGVHWRFRPDTRRRWIILSKISSSMVLTHEMGHYFSLPHSNYRDSLMNKRPRKTPKWPDRVFVSAELKQMQKARDRMLTEGHLKQRRE